MRAHTVCADRLKCSHTELKPLQMHQTNKSKTCVCLAWTHLNSIKAVKHLYAYNSHRISRWTRAINISTAAFLRLQKAWHRKQKIKMDGFRWYYIALSLHFQRSLLPFTPQKLPVVPKLLLHAGSSSIIKEKSSYVGIGQNSLMALSWISFRI